MKARPLFACDAEGVGEISFADNDTLTNIGDSAEQGWLVGTVVRTGQRGLFPAVYTELSPETGDDVAFMRKLHSEGLLSSKHQLEAFRDDLDGGQLTAATSNRSYTSSANHSSVDSGHVTTATENRNFTSQTSSANHSELYSGHVTTSSMAASENRNYSSQSSSANHSYLSQSSVQQSQSVYTSSGGQAPPVPFKPSVAARPAITTSATATRALPPPIPAKRTPIASPPVPPKPRNVVLPMRTDSSQTMSPATSFSQSLGSQTSVSAREQSSSSRVNSANDQETVRQREADAARAWEDAHLAKKPTTLDGSQEVARLFGGLSTGARPAVNVSTKPAVSILRKPAVSAGTKPIVSAGSKPIVSAGSKPAVSVATKPMPAAVRSTAEQIDLDSERDAAASWEAKHGIGSKSRAQSTNTANYAKYDVSVDRKPVVNTSSKPVVAAKPAFARTTGSSTPAAPVLPSKAFTSSTSNTASDTAGSRAVSSQSTSVQRSNQFTGRSVPAAPPLPAKSLNTTARTSPAASFTSSHGSTADLHSASMRSTATQRSNPATENDAPPLPHNPTRARVMDELLVKRKQVPSIEPSKANDAPALPYSSSRAAYAKPVEKPIEATVQPMPRNLISQINSQSSSARSLNSSTSNSSSALGFGDSFDPASAQVALRPQHSSPAFPGMAAARSVVAGRPADSSASFQRSYSSSVTKTEESSTSMTASTGIPLTYSREVKGPMPFASRPGMQQQYSYTNKTSSSSSSFTQHESHASGIGANTHPASITSDALNRYTALFHTLDEQEGRHGYLSSNVVRDTVARSRLPDDQLRRIWQLADRNLNGKFGPGEFNILMYLVDCALRNDPIPDYLPIDLLHTAYA
ncbi:hypothetical protein IWW50_001613 [Coemansia erecta]|nr:hypothetical protein GGF43_001255 [Coemansia sp. RSA 2618]KAJ2827987.1 hypothetical protein IWW50_001613 [Coemansia erecta]